MKENEKEGRESQRAGPRTPRESAAQGQRERDKKREGESECVCVDEKKEEKEEGRKKRAWRR